MSRISPACVTGPFIYFCVVCYSPIGIFFHFLGGSPSLYCSHIFFTFCLVKWRVCIFSAASIEGACVCFFAFATVGDFSLQCLFGHVLCVSYSIFHISLHAGLFALCVAKFLFPPNSPLHVIH